MPEERIYPAADLRLGERVRYLDHEFKVTGKFWHPNNHDILTRTLVLDPMTGLTVLTPDNKERNP